MSRKINRPSNRIFTLLTLALLVFGVFMVYDASVVYSLNVFGGKYNLLLRQAMWGAVGLAAFFIASRINLEGIRKISLPLLIISLIFLIIVLTPGVGSKLLGARRWINLGPLSFQPSEFAKLSFIIYFSFWAEKLRSRKNWLPFLTLLAILLGLILLQPDLGTALILGGVGVGMYFLSGAPIKHFFILAPVVLVLGLFVIIASPYRRQRLLTYIRPSQTQNLQEGYHTNQALIAIGSGGVFGVGPGKSRQKYSYLPEVATDSIFAILCEEFGIIGAVAYLSILGTLLFQGFKISLRGGKFEYRMLAAGVSLWLGVQSVLNLGAITGLLPLTGVPLPLISYGGSAILFLMCGLGFVANVSRQTNY